ncbi:MAG: dihydroneopterin aldolase [Verrucomicrobia subdivision 3 bacterium]|nr:dihydroneopterin aldolase [Limisphaerales bacterium]
MNSFIIISELEVFYHVGVTDEERARPQRLLLNLQIGYDFSEAAQTDELGGTIDYFSVCQRLLAFGKGREWKLIEALASEIANLVLEEFQAARVEVEVRKFIVPQTSHVAVKLVRSRS